MRQHTGLCRRNRQFSCVNLALEHTPGKTTKVADKETKAIGIDGGTHVVSAYNMFTLLYSALMHIAPSVNSTISTKKREPTSPMPVFPAELSMIGMHALRTRFRTADSSFDARPALGHLCDFHAHLRFRPMLHRPY
jgi:extradiol dioxygenase family protein